MLLVRSQVRAIFCERLLLRHLWPAEKLAAALYPLTLVGDLPAFVGGEPFLFYLGEALVMPARKPVLHRRMHRGGVVHKGVIEVKENSTDHA